MDSEATIRQFIPDDIYRELQRVDVCRDTVFLPLEDQERVELFYILAGEVSCFTVDYNGREFVVDTLGPGEFIGKFSQMRNMSFNCGVRAVVDTKLLRLNSHAERLFNDLDFALYFNTKTTDRVYRMYKLMMMRQLFSSRELLAYWLVTLAKGTDTVSDKAEAFCHLAHFSPRQFFYCVKEFVAAGYISKHGRTIKLIDEPALRAIAANVFLFMNE